MMDVPINPKKTIALSYIEAIKYYNSHYEHNHNQDPNSSITVHWDRCEFCEIYEHVVFDRSIKNFNLSKYNISDHEQDILTTMSEFMESLPEDGKQEIRETLKNVISYRENINTMKKLYDGSYPMIFTS